MMWYGRMLVCHVLKLFLYLWKVAQVPVATFIPLSARPYNVKWQKPALGFIKCNTDVAMLPYGVGLACLLRDDVGNFIAVKLSVSPTLPNLLGA